MTWVSDPADAGTVPTRPIALTMGEPAGIGGEIALKAWLARDADVPPFFLIDDADRLRRLADDLSLDAPISPIAEPAAALGCFAEALPVLDRPLSYPVRSGCADPRNAAAVIASIETAVALVGSGDAAAVVTNPIRKKTLFEAGFSYPGHTELLAALAGGAAIPVMMLTCPILRVVPVTVHLCLRQAIEALTTNSIIAAAHITSAALQQDFGIEQPRLAIAGLNPHAGEDGEMGDEEATVIIPAIDRLRAGGIEATGPHPPDTLFSPRVRAGYDAAICMYHDQALIPLKALDFDGGVNVTLGLPFVRTSPDHGTALDIAGTGQASEASLLAALRLAHQLARRRVHG